MALEHPSLWHKVPHCDDRLWPPRSYRPGHSVHHFYTFFIHRKYLPTWPHRYVTSFLNLFFLWWCSVVAIAERPVAVIRAVTDDSLLSFSQARMRISFGNIPKIQWFLPSKILEAAKTRLISVLRQFQKKKFAPQKNIINCPYPQYKSYQGSAPE